MNDARTALAQAMRAERIGGTRFAWDMMDRAAQEDWRRRADHILRLLAADGYTLTPSGNAKPTANPPTSPDVYAIIGHAPETERIIRSTDDAWQLVSRSRHDGAERILLTTTLTQTDIDGDVVLSGNPEAQKLPAIGTRLAMSTMIRKLHADTQAPS